MCSNKDVNSTTNKNKYEMKISKLLVPKMLDELSGSEIRVLLFLLANCSRSEMSSLDLALSSIELGTSKSIVLKSLKKLNKVRFIDLKICDDDISIRLRFKESGELEEETDVVTPDTKAMVSKKEILTHFCTRYKEHYGVDYKVSFARDYKLIGNILEEHDVSLEDCCSIIDLAFRVYDTKWKNTNYPTLTIGALSSFIFSNCKKDYCSHKDSNTNKNTYENDRYTELF